MAVGQELCLWWELGHSRGAFLVGNIRSEDFGVWVKDNGKSRERPLDLPCSGLGITKTHGAQGWAVPIHGGVQSGGDVALRGWAVGLRGLLQPEWLCDPATGLMAQEWDAAGASLPPAPPQEQGTAAACTPCTLCASGRAPGRDSPSPQVLRSARSSLA